MSLKNSNPIQTASVTIPAAIFVGGVLATPGTISSDLAGQVFCCVLATAPFKLAFNAGGFFDCIQGAVIPVGQFSQITFQNLSAVPVTVQFAVGVEGITFIPTNTFKEAPSYPWCTEIDGLGAGLTQTFTGSQNNGLNLRKQIIITNLDTGGGILEVQDGRNVSGEVIAAGAPPWTAVTSGLVNIKNVSGAAISRILVFETFYA